MPIDRAESSEWSPPVAGTGEIATGRALERLVWLFVGLGLAIRVTRYLVDYPLWHDEAFVAANLIHRGFVELLRPLDYSQVAPAAFLAIELAAVRLFGFAELPLRLFPFLCGLAGMVVFERLARAILSGPARVAAVAILATSVYSIRHTAEVKPYSSDLLAAAVLLLFAVRAAQEPGRSRRLWWLAAIVPVCLAVSYPAILVTGGILCALAPQALRAPSRAVRLGFLTFAIVTVASFLAIYFGVTYIQSDALRVHYREGYWREAFPSWDRPWLIPLWLLRVHTGTPMAYPVGGDWGASSATFAACVAGAIALHRAGRSVELKLLLAPVLMGLIAASLGRYPYGGAPRLTQYLVPTIAILAAAGLGRLFQYLATRGVSHGGFRLATLAFALLGCGIMARDVIWPYRVESDLRTRQFARWFWTEYARGTDLVCAREDLQIDARPALWNRGMSAIYLCHRAMFAQRQPAPTRDPANLAASDRPARIVFFDKLPEAGTGPSAWLSALSTTHEIGPPREFLIHPGRLGEAWLRDCYIVVPVTPRNGEALARKPDPQDERPTQGVFTR